MTKNCQKPETDRINAFIDNELNPEEMIKVDSHLKSCSVCGDYYRGIKIVSDTLSRASSHCSAPVGLWSRIMSTVETRRKNMKFIKISFAAAASMILVFGISLISPPSRDNIYKYVYEQTDLDNGTETDSDYDEEDNYLLAYLQEGNL